MRKLNIEEYEELEDIEIALDKELLVNKDNFYFNLKDSINLIIDKNNDKYVVNICSDGFIEENPNITNLCEDSEFTKDELIDFIKNFNENYNTKMNKIKQVEIEELYTRKNLKLEGINLKGCSTYVDYYGEYEIDKSINKIFYLSNLRNIYRLNFYEEQGMCGSGYTTASWGNVEITKCDRLPRELMFVPKETILVNIPKDKIENRDDFYMEMKKEETEEIIGNVSVSYDGGDYYYPSGYVSDDIALDNPLNSSNKEKILNIFNIKENLIEEAINLKEIIPLENIKDKEEYDEIKDDYDDYMI